jgi:hypothetical protein
VTATEGASGYALTLSEDELRRYQFMAEAARQTEQDLWQAAGIARGAAVADIGCGPGALFPAIMDVIGSGGRLIGVDANPRNRRSGAGHDRRPRLTKRDSAGRTGRGDVAARELGGRGDGPVRHRT